MATVTPTYSWPVPTSTDYVADGAVAIEALGDAIDGTLTTALGGAYPGLRLVKTQTIGTGVSSVTVNDAFSSTYENYKILVSGGVASANSDLQLKLGSAASGHYNGVVYVVYSGGTVFSIGNSNVGTFTYIGAANTSNIDVNLDLNSPFLTKNTTFRAVSTQMTTTGAPLLNGGYQANATSFTGFTISPQGAQTLTGGTIYVYGYGAS